MKATGILRKIDELGRIVIPKEMRDSMGIREGDPMEIYVQDDRIVLQKFSMGCIFCGGSEELGEYKGKPVCRICLGNIARGI